jgi:hypothetical protein
LGDTSLLELLVAIRSLVDRTVVGDAAAWRANAPLDFIFALALTQHLRKIALQHDVRNILIMVVREGLEPSTSAL